MVYLLPRPPFSLSPARPHTSPPNSLPCSHQALKETHRLLQSAALRLTACLSLSVHPHRADPHSHPQLCPDDGDFCHAEAFHCHELSVLVPVLTLFIYHVHWLRSHRTCLVPGRRGRECLMLCQGFYRSFAYYDLQLCVFMRLMCTDMCVSASACVYKCVCLCINMCVQTCVSQHPHVCTDVCLCIHMCVQACVSLHLHVYTSMWCVSASICVSHAFSLAHFLLFASFVLFCLISFLFVCFIFIP